MRTEPYMTSILLLGCGKMGAALLQGWLKQNAAMRYDVVEPQGLPSPFQSRPDIHWHAASAKLPPADIAVLAVKPQVMEEACRSLKPAIRPDTLILSIAAGQTLAAFSRRFGMAQPVIRAMPNTPAAIGQGVTVAVGNSHVTAARKKAADALLKAGGTVEWTDDETLMDAVTAVSGSGPAYVFLLMEALAAAGVKAGLPEPLSLRLARQTVIGASALAAAEPDTSAATLRKNVTSPGGTTEAALNILMANDGLASLMTKAVNAAQERSRDLSQS